MTEWRQFRLPTWNVIQKVMTDKYIVDGRNIWNRVELEEMGFSYTRIGEKQNDYIIALISLKLDVNS